jgi:hypothetical protein
MNDITRAGISRIGAGIGRVGRRMNRTTDERIEDLHRQMNEHIEDLHRQMNERIEDLHREVSPRIDDVRAEVVRQGERVFDRVIEFEIRSRRDIVYAGDQQAGRESNEFATQHLTDALQCDGSAQTMRYALSQAPAGGMALEFGVASGATLRMIVEERGADQTYGFDSFKGLPDSWLAGMPAGTFARGDLPDVGGAELVVGLFDDMLPKFLEEHPGPVDFLHIDSDLYSSAKTVLELVGPRLRTGSIVQFDEFFNYPGWRLFEYRAWNEYVEKTGLGYSYIAFAYNDCQLVARVDTPPGS